MHSKLTLSVTGLLLILSTAFMIASEWRDPDTLGPLSVPGRILAGFFQAVMLRTAGFNSVNVGDMNDGTWLGMDVFMFIGGGSAGTAGVIKVTTFALLFFVIVAEVRGEARVNVFDRRIDPRAQRQAVAVALLSVAAVVGSTILLVWLSGQRTDAVLFESVSAFATVGLSTGITAQLPPIGQLVLVALMFVGRLGPVTLVSALALRESRLRYLNPEGRPLIG